MVQARDALVIRGRQHVLVVVFLVVWGLDLLAHDRLLHLLVVYVAAHFSQLHLLRRLFEFTILVVGGRRVLYYDVITIFDYESVDCLEG